MALDFAIDTVAPADLGPLERSLWVAFRDASPSLASPYFDLRFVLAAGEVCPQAAIAVIRRHGEIEAFFPFQRRGGLIQPLGAPLADYHGVVARPGVRIDAREILSRLGASRLRVTGLRGDGLKVGEGLAAHRAMEADLAGGYEAYVEARRAAGHGAFFKDKRRRAKALERDFGSVTFALEPFAGETLSLIVRLKREQMARAGQYDIFDCAWTEKLLRRLLDSADPAFGAQVAVLRVAGQVIAAEVGLRSGAHYHLWFPVYDPAFARYSPGQLMTLRTLEALAVQGVTSVDFGPGGEAYKAAFASPGDVVREGSVLANPFGAAFAERLAVVGPARKLGRRFDRIAACEIRASRRLFAASKYAAVVADRYRSVTVALGLGLTVVGFALAVAD